MKLGRSRTYKGPAPKKPETVELALCDVIKTTDGWLRRYEEAWFDKDEYSTLEFGLIKSGRLDAIPDLCDDANEALDFMEKYVVDARKALKKLKSQAKKAARA
ncbi:MAG: hypothetical protein QGG09_06870 [Pirellulaceae bacterium]|jgi:hypothetical protein|nr:hypothetical protein [Pirellulaceae bacterium]HJN11256.1 hypothetical protein [Pirellulaceae bacterium]